MLTVIAFTAKRHRGYPESWIQRWGAALTVTPLYITRNPTFLATIDGQPGGFCALKSTARESLLDHLWVLPSFMGKGVGRALFQHAMVVAKSGGAERMRIVGDPHAEGFYLRMGTTLYGSESANMEGEERSLPLFEILL